MSLSLLLTLGKITHHPGVSMIEWEILIFHNTLPRLTNTHVKDKLRRVTCYKYLGNLRNILEKQLSWEKLYQMITVITYTELMEKGCFRFSPATLNYNDHILFDAENKSKKLEVVIPNYYFS